MSRIVSYLKDGHFVATRHHDSCGVLANARRQLRESRARSWGQRARGAVKTQGFEALQIYTEAAYRHVPGAEGRPPKDHTCMGRLL